MSLDAAPPDDELRRIATERLHRRNGVELGPRSPLLDHRITKQPGPKSARSLEHLEQVAFFDWAESMLAEIPQLALLYAVPNGGKRSIAVAGKLKMEGVKPGVPDVVLPVARGTYHALYIEMKEPRGGITPAQADWQFSLSREGNRVVVCTTWEAARDHVLAYLHLPVTP